MSKIEAGRLALRQEGLNWNAYYADIGTMEGAVLLGSIQMSLVIANPERKQAFIDLMRDCITDIIKVSTGAEAEWLDPSSAPESERSGNA